MTPAKSIVCLFAVFVVCASSKVATGQVLETDKRVYRAGETISLSYYGMAGTATDWIALVQKFKHDCSYPERQWLKSIQSGSLRFTAPQKGGEYEFHAFFNWENEKPNCDVRARLKLTVDDSARKLISKFSSVLDLDEKGLATALLEKKPKAVANVLRSLDRVDRDDVAYEFLVQADKPQLDALATTTDGRELFTLMLAELADGWTTAGEAQQRDEILKLLPDNRPLNDAAINRAKEVEQLRQKAKAKIATHTRLFNLDEEALGRAILKEYMNTPNMGTAVVENLSYFNKDDVSLEFMKAATNADLSKFSESHNGRAMLRRMVQEMSTGNISTEERRQMRRAMKAVTHRQLEDLKGKAIDVEVITFMYGSKATDGLGVVFGGGAKGHTAIVVGDQVYSFEELGWRAGKTRAEYLADNKWRPALGQSLNLSRVDAKRILDDLNGSVGTGRYLIGGDVCTDATARVLQQTLPNLRPTADFNPNRFVGDLLDKAQIKHHRFYPEIK
ncbi:MAG: hypothetical protein JXQ99_15895 [Hyphomicrobiaceae bacterium]